MIAVFAPYSIRWSMIFCDAPGVLLSRSLSIQNWRRCSFIPFFSQRSTSPSVQDESMHRIIGNNVASQHPHRFISHCLLIKCFRLFFFAATSNTTPTMYSKPPHDPSYPTKPLAHHPVTQANLLHPNLAIQYFQGQVLHTLSLPSHHYHLQKNDILLHII